MSRRLPQSFYARDALVVAKELLGKQLHAPGVTLRITEVEAYCYPDDTANHCRVGRTARNAAMWGAPGHAYVYLCYGLHSMLNVVTNREGEGAAVLIRACEPVRGLRTIVARRGGVQGANLLTGPGKVAAALLLDPSFNGHCLFRSGGLELTDGEPPSAILSGPRVGIAYALPEHQLAPWRFAAADSAWVSQRKTLMPTSTLDETSMGHGRTRKRT